LGHEGKCRDEISEFKAPIKATLAQAPTWHTSKPRCDRSFREGNASHSCSYPKSWVVVTLPFAYTICAHPVGSLRLRAGELHS
jgi:hypothetical protein